MADMAYNRLTLSGTYDDKEQVFSFLRSDSSLDEEFHREIDFMKIIPIPFNEIPLLEDEKYLTSQENAYYHSDVLTKGVYEFCCNNWGTKWNALQTKRDGDTLTFSTAWNGVPELIEYVANKFPKVSFEYEWACDIYPSHTGKGTFFNLKNDYNEYNGNQDNEAWDVFFELFPDDRDKFEKSDEDGKIYSFKKETSDESKEIEQKPIEIYQFIENENETKWFWSKLPHLEPTESYYFCMAARAKKLSNEEREKYQLGRSEMFYPEIMGYKGDSEWRFEDFIKHVYKLQTDKRAFLTKNYLPFPDNSLICYFAPNPCNEIACIMDFRDYFSQIENELIRAAQKGSSKGITEQFSKLARSMHHYKTCHPQHSSRKIWMDFDFDFTDKGLDERGESERTIDTGLQKFFPKDGYLLIRTSGGVHALVKREFIKFNPADVCNSFIDSPESWRFKEVVKNDNGFVPLPGTRHYLKGGGYIMVEVVNKDSFKE